MGRRTGIQWCDDTVNPTTGCDGCELWAVGKGGPCYAGNFHELRLARSLPALYAPTFDEVRLAPGRMARAAGASDLTGTARPDKPWLNGLPRVIFVGDLGDVMSKAVPFDYLRAEIVDVARSPKGARHIWMLLTKQPSRLAEFAEWLQAEHGIDWPANLWAGTSITTAKTLKRIDRLRKVPAAVRFVSAEPMRGPISLTSKGYIAATGDHPEMYGFMAGPDDGASVLYRTPGEALARSGIGLVIVGGESDQGEHRAHPFNLEWARDLIRECKLADVPCFVKQLGSRPYSMVYNENSTTDPGDDVPLRLKDHHGGDWWEWPADLRVRQFPRPAEAR